jgi:hypothetical protein
MEEITIKVPAPFSGLSDLGFTARYPEQEPYSASPDVPFVFEGPAAPMQRLLDRLRLLRGRPGGAYAWTDPVMLNEELVVMAFHDRSLEPGEAGDAAASRGFVENAVRPVIFPLLRDFAGVADLRLADLIEIRVQASRQRVAELRLRLEEIVQPNGQDYLWSF